MSKSMDGIVSSNQFQNHMQVGEAVIFAVAEAEEVSPFDLTPLTNAIDPDALHNFVESLGVKQDEPVGLVEFQYRGHDITVSADGSITVDGHEFS